MQAAQRLKPYEKLRVGRGAPNPAPDLMAIDPRPPLNLEKAPADGTEAKLNLTAADRPGRRCPRAPKPAIPGPRKLTRHFSTGLSTDSGDNHALRHRGPPRFPPVPETPVWRQVP